MPTTPKHRPLWNSDLSVGSRDLDTHHRHLGLLVNRLADTPPGPGGRFLAHDVLRELAAYAAYHFELEEALMASVRFPGLAAHQTEHLQFCEVVAEAGYGAALGVIDHAELGVPDPLVARAFPHRGPTIRAVSGPGRRSFQPRPKRQPNAPPDHDRPGAMP